jgi:hypothetical protein
MRRYATVKAQYEQYLKTWQRDARWENVASMLFTTHNHFRSMASYILHSSKPALDDFEQLSIGTHYHHTLEDTHFFPQLQRKFNIDKNAMQKLEDDHAEVDVAEERVMTLSKQNEDTTQAMHEYIDLILTHMAREEMLLMPYLLQLRSLSDL